MYLTTEIIKVKNNGVKHSLAQFRKGSVLIETLI
jgi:hypothetical protein